MKNKLKYLILILPIIPLAIFAQISQPLTNPIVSVGNLTVPGGVGQGNIVLNGQSTNTFNGTVITQNTTISISGNYTDPVAATAPFPQLYVQNYVFGNLTGSGGLPLTANIIMPATGIVTGDTVMLSGNMNATVNSIKVLVYNGTVGGRLLDTYTLGSGNATNYFNQLSWNGTDWNSIFASNLYVPDATVLGGNLTLINGKLDANLGTPAISYLGQSGNVSVGSSDTSENVTFSTTFSAAPHTIILSGGFASATQGAFIIPVLDQGSVQTGNFTVRFTAPGVAGGKVYWAAFP